MRLNAGVFPHPNNSPSPRPELSAQCRPFDTTSRKLAAVDRQRVSFLFEGSGCLGFITAAESHGGVVHGFVREELPLVCQKCNPAVTRRDPALRGKLLRQKCVSVGAPSCLASLSLSVSLFLSILLTTSTSRSFFFLPLTLQLHMHLSITQSLSSCPSFSPLLFTSSFF